MGPVPVAQAAFEPDGGFASSKLPDFRARYSVVVGMLEPFRGTIQQFGLAPAQRPGPGRVDGSPDVVAIGDQQKVLRHVPDPVALPALFPAAPRQRRIQSGELVRKLAIKQPALPQRLLRQDLFGNVGVGADQAYGSAILVTLDGGFDRNPPRLAVVGTNDPILHAILADT